MQLMHMSSLTSPSNFLMAHLAIAIAMLLHVLRSFDRWNMCASCRHLAQLMWALATCQRLAPSHYRPTPAASYDPGTAASGPGQGSEGSRRMEPVHALLSAAWLEHFYDKAGCQLRVADAHSLALLGWSLAGAYIFSCGGLLT